MNYDTIIVELLSRVQALEEQVETLKGLYEITSVEKAVNNMNPEKKISTSDIREYIDSLKQKARKNGETNLIIVARDISNELHLKQRYPMVCNAMRQSMSEGDEIVFSPESGYSSTLEIKYYL